MKMTSELFPGEQVGWSAGPSDLRMLTINISGPSLERAERLRGYLLGLDLDVMVLTETRGNAGTAELLRSLSDEGYEVVAPAPTSAGERGVAVASRKGVRDLGCGTRRVDLSHRLVVCEIGGVEAIRLVAAYVPSRDASAPKIERKQRFLRQMQAVLKEQSRLGRVVFLGDLNVVGRSHEPRYPVFRPWEYEVLESVDAVGFVDSFAELHPGVQAHSWIGRTGNGYRYDYGFVSSDLEGCVGGCEYLHDPREAGLSDHAGFLMTVAPSEMSTSALGRGHLAAAAG